RAPDMRGRAAGQPGGAGQGLRMHDEGLARRAEERELFRRFRAVQRATQQAVDELLRDGVTVTRLAEALGRAAPDHLVPRGVDDDDAHSRRHERARDTITLYEGGLGFPLRRIERAVGDVVEPLPSQPNRPVM